MAQPEVSKKAKLAILAAGLLSFVGILIETSMNVTFPTLISELGVGLSTVQWLSTGYLLLVTIVMSTTAFVLKKFNPRNIFIFAATVCFIGGLLCLAAPSFWLLMLGRLLQATATGLSTPLMFQLIFSTVPVKKLGLYTGLASVIISLAPALGPTYGGVMTSMWSWRAIFIGVLPILALVAVLGFFAIGGTAQGVGTRKFDTVGTLLLAASFTSLLFTFAAAGSAGWLSLKFLGMVAFSAILCACMVLYAQRGSRKLFDYTILRHPVLRSRLFTYFGLQFINIGLSFLLPIFTQTIMGASALDAGLMLLPGTIIGAAIAPFAGRYYDHHGPTLLLIFCTSMMTASLVLFVMFTHSLTITTTALLFVMLRIGFNCGFGTTISDGSIYVDGSQKADQNSMFSMTQQYAGSLGTAVLSAVVSAFGLAAGSVKAMYAGGQLDFALLALLAASLLITVSISAVRHPVRR